MLCKNKKQLDLYKKYIQAVASLSRLFNDSHIPFLHYRTTENIFCKSFQAENLSRADTAYDAKIDNIGIGIKTFIATNESNQKIAEFNKRSKELTKIKDEEQKLVKELSKLRNERIDFANRVYGIKKGIYHCLMRQKNQIIIFESDYSSININEIRNIKSKDKSIYFEDGINKYSFNFSKSTLYKRFSIPQNKLTIDIKIIDDPYNLILNLLRNYDFSETIEDKKECVILPMYSTKNLKNKIIPEKSGLNQWNAGGRKRNLGEVYIPIPQKIHKLKPDFFPRRNKEFELILPSNQSLKAKICQEGNKALMTNPNHDLSEWLLRKTLKLQKGKLLTYNHLIELGIDSLKITKINQKQFKIDFVKINSYEKFIEKSIKENEK